ncbi:MAG: flagellar biosynthesis anti-sigma factor FlgM [Burkholderiaceae bacterium]
MYVSGTHQLHAAQPLSSPHRTAPVQGNAPAGRAWGMDEVSISPEADLVSQVHQMPDIRADKVADIRAQIASGAYETDEKLNVALDRLLDELA